MKEYKIFISSSDAYSDLWPIFFELFRKFWPEYQGEVYLNTETRNYSFDGIDIRCTKVGNLGDFGKVFRAGLDSVNSQNILLIMIDYFFMGRVDDNLLNEYYEIFKRSNLHSLCLVRNPYTHSIPLGELDLELVTPPSQDMFSFQIAFWKKDILMEMVLPHETPWLAEWYGTARANQMGLRLAYPIDRSPITYLAEGALHKGKWVPQIINYLIDSNYQIDFSKRGLYVEKTATIGQRVKGRFMTFLPRCLSNLDLTRRRLAK